MYTSTMLSTMPSTQTTTDQNEEIGLSLFILHRLLFLFSLQLIASWAFLEFASAGLSFIFGFVLLTAPLVILPFLFPKSGLLKEFFIFLFSGMLVAMVTISEESFIIYSIWVTFVLALIFMGPIYILFLLPLHMFFKLIKTKRAAKLLLAVCAIFIALFVPFLLVSYSHYVPEKPYDDGSAH